MKYRIKESKEAKNQLPSEENSNYASLNPWHTKKDNIVLVAYLNGNASSSVQKRRIKAKTKGGAQTVSASYGWKLSKRSSNSAFTPGARVLCLLPAVDLEDDDDDVEVKGDVTGAHDAPLENFKGEIVRKMMSRSDKKIWFEGKLAERLDDQVRIHFQGLKKDEDVWMSSSSEHLVIDGGSVPEDTLEEAMTTAMEAEAKALRKLQKAAPKPPPPTVTPPKKKVKPRESRTSEIPASQAPGWTILAWSPR